MSAILGVFCDADGGRVPSETIGRRMLEAMRARGDERTAIWTRDGALVAAARHGWECDVDLGGEALVRLIVEETHTCYLGERGELHDWGHGCGRCPACELRARGFAQYREQA